jgi:hypothetical protein
MKLSVNIVFDELSRLYPNARLNKNENWFNDLALLLPLLYDPDASFEHHRVYVLDPENLPAQLKLDKNCLLVSGQLPLKYHNSLRFLAIILDAAVGVVKLYNDIIKIFEKYAAWDEALKDLLLKDAPLTDYLACSFPIIENPLRIIDNNYRYLARFKEDIIRKEYAHINSQEYVVPELLKDYDENAAIFFSGSREVTSAPNVLISGAALRLSLFEGAVKVATLYVHNNNRPFKNQDTAMVKYMGGYLEAALAHFARKGEVNSLLRKTMMKIISGHVYNAGDIQQFKNLLPLIFRKEQQFVCLAAVDMTPGLTPQYSARRIEMAEFLPDQHLYLFKDYALQFFLQKGCSILPARLMAAKCIRQLAERDKGAAVSYCETLRVYLAADRDTSYSARILGIQRNTLIARLERIRKLLDLNLDNPRERLYAEISLLLLEKEK